MVRFSEQVQMQEAPTPEYTNEIDVDDWDLDSIASDISENEAYKKRSTVAVTVDKEGKEHKPIFPFWTKITEHIHHGMTTFCVFMATNSAKYPITVIVAITVLSLGLLVAGFFTGFHLELDFEIVFAPSGSLPEANYNWIQSDEGFPAVRNVIMLFHTNGDDVLRVETMERVFEGLDTVRETDGFMDLCMQGSYVDFDGNPACRIMSATGFWANHSVEVFLEETTTDEELKLRVSNFTFANGAPVYHDAIMGNYERDDTGNITFAQSFLVTVDIPDIDDKVVNEFERDLLDRLDSLRRRWLDEDAASGDTIAVLDVMTIYAYEIEFMRAIIGDLYLIPVVAIIMCGFVAGSMANCSSNKNIKSRAVLGLFAVYTICMSFLAGNGLMFLCGVPFTTITQILPFVVFGIGLDDTFIITGEYFRTDPRLDTIERIRMTFNEVAHSICLTTITTTFAFLLGLASSLPGVKWLCLYAFVTISIDFLFQITMFSAWIVIDERRIQAHRRDILCCLRSKEYTEKLRKLEAAGKIEAGSARRGSVSAKDAKGHQHHVKRGSVGVTQLNAISEDRASTMRASQIGRRRTSIARRVTIFKTKSLPERIMSRYADFVLMKPVKYLIVLIFAGFTAACAWSATKLTQEFRLGDFVPSDSYLKDVLYTLENYASVIRPMAVYFRNIDQGDPDIQQQMITYVEEMEDLEQIAGSLPIPEGIDLADFGFAGANITEVAPFCWVRDFTTLLAQYGEDPQYAFLADLTFEEQLNFALTTQPIARELYGQDIIRDDEGNIISSRCWMFLSDLDLNSVTEQLEMLHDQREVGARQPLNQNVPEWSMFFFDSLLFYWEAYDIALRELISTIISGIVAVACLSVILMPHWTAVFIVTPLIIMLYVNYLGLLQFMGLHINGILYICVVVAVGLLVDFLMHVLLRYYETSPTKTRDERVRETLETMGASILMGGLTTFLGVVPLSFSTTEIFMLVFLAFFGMIILGVSHGLILLPVLLSLIGPTSGIDIYEDNVMTFDNDDASSTTTRDQTKEELVEELKKLDELPVHSESGAAEGDEDKAFENDATTPEQDSDTPSEELPQPDKRQTLTQVEM